MVTISEKILSVRTQIAEAAKIAGRDPGDIALLAVTKTRSVQEMLEAEPLVDAIGENRVQEAIEKRGNINWEKQWRLIGNLQKNKIRKALEIFDTIDSINSVELVLALQRILAEKNDRILPVLIEVNTAEDSKTGADPRDVPRIADAILNSANLKLDGLMTIAPLTRSIDYVRKSFIMLRQMSETLAEKTGAKLPVLSMGMSGDFRIAISEGSTLVRIGTALFS